MDIEKIAIGLFNDVSGTVQKPVQKVLAQTVTIENSQKLTNALDRLASNAKVEIKLRPKEFEYNLDEKTLAKIKKKLSVFTDNDKMPDDKTLGFLATYFCDKTGDNRHFDREILQAFGATQGRFNKFSPKEKEAFFNSKFLSFIMSGSDSKAFKLSCICMPDNLENLDKLTEDKLTRSFLKSFFKEQNGDFDKLKILLPKLNKAITSTLTLTNTKVGEQFYDLLVQRNYKDIKGISEILTSRINNLSKKEADELHSVLNFLLEAKTPDGANIFGYSDASDKTKKMLLDGIENILNAKENDPEKYKQLMELLQLTKEGKIPPSVLGVLAKKGEINQEFLVQIEKIKLGIPFVSVFESKTQALQKSTLGDVVKINDKLFYRLDNELKPLNISQENFEKLFPPIESMSFSQGQLGDCYLVGTINDFMTNSNARVKLYKMFEQDGDDIIVRIPDAKEFPIRFSKQVLEQDGQKNINASLGIQMIEDAYKQTRSLKYGTANKMTAIEGGMQSDAYNALLGSKNAQTYLVSTNDIARPKKEELLQKIKEIQEDILSYKKEIKNIKDMKDDDTLLGHTNYLLNEVKKEKLNTLEATERQMYESLETIDNYHIVDSEDLIKKLLQYSKDKKFMISAGTKQGDYFDKDKLIHGGHAYSILGVDKEKQIIQVVNPWNTAQSTTLSFEEFKNYFNGICVAQVL